MFWTLGQNVVTQHALYVLRGSGKGINLNPFYRLELVPKNKKILSQNLRGEIEKVAVILKQLTNPPVMNS